MPYLHQTTLYRKMKHILNKWKQQCETFSIHHKEGKRKQKKRSDLIDIRARVQRSRWHYEQHTRIWS